MLNKCMVIGNLGANPEIRTFPAGGRVANFRIATTEKWTDKASGEKRERTQWHSVACFNDALIGVIERFAKKGARLYVEGQLEYRKWQDQSGQDRWTTEIVLRPFNGTIELLGDPNGNRNGGSGGSYSDRYGAGSDVGGGYDRTGSLDDEIPF